MKFKLSLGGKTLTADIVQSGEAVEVRLDGERVQADARWVAPSVLSLLIEGQSFELVTEANGDERVTVTGPGVKLVVGCGASARNASGGAAAAARGQRLTSPMPGKIVDVMVKAGQRVEAGQGLVIVEAMKMENELAADAPGVVAAVHVERDQVVNSGEVLVELGPPTAD